ncbi:CLUMA_CG020602, isoform A [Clunio marinus]|uniref:CLUMA_CG020602, isoform A n=1 Tax=Clunio marinus TaxID=568069 RepID=A0A1J1J830_9DIPT|nr:CLUMA_CG020602, isoform A [Clunio marinus]
MFVNMFENVESYVQSSLVVQFFQMIFTRFSPLTVLLTTTVTIWLINYNRRRSRLVRLIEKVPGPPALPFVGNAIEINVEPDEVFARLTGVRKLFGRRQGISRCWMLSVPYVMISKPECVEPILSSPKHIDKSSDYSYLHPWLGTGLLTSFGSKWHSRRKILTPAFHFKILEDFIDIFNEQSSILVRKLSKEVNKDSFNIFPYVTLCTLDIVCETAMGQNIKAQSNSDSDYVKAVYEIGSVVQKRQARFWMQSDFIFKLTEDYKTHERCLKILHGFSYGVIRERKEQMKTAELLRKNKFDQNNNKLSVDENGNNTGMFDDEESFGKKKRLAFLDLLITASGNGSILNDEDIREEVDTFMFEGHDTTSAAVSWCLFLIGSNLNIQEKALQEIDEVMGGDRDRAPTMKELNEMKYLECCIKEALRLYPSVPLIARHLKEDVMIDKYLIPAGTTAMIVTYQLHRNPEIFKNPERYDPDRFLPENCIGRHPYSYIPFSAGPRNCIGQKFAILEEKAIISSVLRKYKIEAVDRREDLTLLGELILRPKDGLAVKITARQ